MVVRHLVVRFLSGSLRRPEQSTVVDLQLRRARKMLHFGISIGITYIFYLGSCVSKLMFQRVRHDEYYSDVCSWIIMDVLVRTGIAWFLRLLYLHPCISDEAALALLAASAYRLLVHVWCKLVV